MPRLQLLWGGKCGRGAEGVGSQVLARTEEGRHFFHLINLVPVVQGWMAPSRPSHFSKGGWWEGMTHRSCGLGSSQGEGTAMGVSVLYSNHRG